MFWKKNRLRERFILILVLIFVLLLPAFFRPFVQVVDPIGYYSWLQSAVIEKTLDVRDAFDHYSREFDLKVRDINIHHNTPTGYTYNQWAAGSAALWAPAFLVAHAGVTIARSLGAMIPADGYSWPYPLAASLSSALYGLIALYMIFIIARSSTDRFSAGLATLASWLATPMVFYMYCHPLMSHTNDAFVNALFVFVWWKTQGSSSSRAGLARGLAAGLATWVRTQNAVLIIILGLEVFVDLLTAFHRKASIKPAFYRGVTTLAGYLLLFLPLMIFWRVVFGSWLLNTYSATHGSHILDWGGFHVLQVLFSSNRGLFVWAPVTLPALIGLRWLHKENPRLTMILTGMFLSQLYVVSSWYGWSGNVAFGPRFWVGQTVIFAIGLAALIKTGRNHTILWPVAAGIFVTWNFLLIVQYALKTIPRYGPVDLGLMVRNQFTVIPENLSRILRIFIDRGR